ncbi:MAG TPA: hypothetical protein VKR58_14150 [Aquella sp.]|nr:hypothetical protein [Aquella sp.]
MQSKQINLKLTPSKLPLIALLFGFICGYIISHYLPQLKYFVFGAFVVICLFWLYKYLNFKEHNLIINTNSDCHALVSTHACDARNDSTHVNDSASGIPVQIVKFRHISWWLSIVYLYSRDLGKKQKLYLFADSVPFRSYKSFKIYSQWI